MPVVVDRERCEIVLGGYQVDLNALKLSDEQRALYNTLACLDSTVEKLQDSVPGRDLFLSAHSVDSPFWGRFLLSAFSHSFKGRVFEADPDHGLDQACHTILSLVSDGERPYVNAFADAIRYACSWLKGEMENDGVESLVMHLHGRLHAPCDTEAGRYRRLIARVVGIGSEGDSPLASSLSDIRIKMAEICHYAETSMDHPVVIAAHTSNMIQRIQPFSDGNKSTSRLILNVLLLQRNYPGVIISVDDRDPYITSLGNPHEKCTIKHEVFIAQRLLQQLREHAFIPVSHDFPHFPVSSDRE